jgi:protein XagA
LGEDAAWRKQNVWIGFVSGDLRWRVVMLAARCAFVSAMVTTHASAGAWTMTEGETQIISNVTMSHALWSYGNSGSPMIPLTYAKLWTSTTAEYGLTDDITLNVEGDYASAQTGASTSSLQHASDFAYGGGVRYRLLNSDFGVLSAQATYKSAGAFDLSVSANDVGGQQAEFRLLYGTNFMLFGHDGFVDIEAGERWLSGARPNETPIDITAGIHLGHHNMLMLQNFNIIAGGDARPPFGYYRIHKLAVSLVTGPWHHLSFQSGAFFSPAGQNSLVETGVFAAIWADF